jgi:hypothetical protein
VMWCRHAWREVSRTFNRPSYGAEMSLVPMDVAERACHGFTNIELRCESCGDVKVVQTIGRTIGRTG